MKKVLKIGAIVIGCASAVFTAAVLFILCIGDDITGDLC